MYRWTEGKDIYENAVGSVILTFHKQAQVHSLQRKGKLDSSWRELRPLVLACSGAVQDTPVGQGAGARVDGKWASNSSTYYLLGL